MQFTSKQSDGIPDMIGETCRSGSGIEWKIKNYLHLPKDKGASYRSDSFLSNGESWCLKIYPNGCYTTTEHINLCLVKISSSPPISIDLYLALKTVSGTRDLERKSTAVFDDFHCFHISSRFVSKSELHRREAELLPVGILTVVCDIKIMASTESASLISLCRDYKKVLLCGTNHDIIIKVGNREFQAHQDILKARSRVFQSMLSHDMAEKNSRIIHVSDFEPDIMEQLLLYIYCGKVDKMDKSNMFELYSIADKYEIEELKDESSQFIKKSLCPTIIFEVIQFALNHNDSYIEEYATEYFINNTQDILSTTQW